jgi:hypothetical protein
MEPDARTRGRDRWIDPLMTTLVVCWFIIVLVCVLLGAWPLVAGEIVALVAIAPVLAVTFDEHAATVLRFARRPRRMPLRALRVDVWHGAHGGTQFARLRYGNDTPVMVRALGGPHFVETAARDRGVEVHEAAAGERPDVPVLALIVSAIVLGTVVLILAVDALLF